MKTQEILLILDDLHPILQLLHIIRVYMMQLLDLRLLDYVVGYGRELASNRIRYQFLLLRDVLRKVA
jgi:hypothetical protein